MSAAMFVDHYAVLGVKRNASIKEINVAWKRFALKYHPDKCNQIEDATEKFRTVRCCLTLPRLLMHRPLEVLHGYQELTNYTSQGREAVETLRDPQRRYEYDRELDARYSSHQTSRTGWDCHPPQPSSVYYWPMNPQSYHSNGTRYFTERSTSRGKGRHGNGFDGPPRGYMSEAEMDMIFEMVKARERDRLAAEAHKKQQAEAVPGKYRAQVKPDMHPWGNDDYARVDLEARKARAERRKEGFKALVMRDEEELIAAENDEIEGDGTAGDTSTTTHQSAVYVSAESSFHNSSDCNFQLSTARTLSSAHDSSTQSGGMHLADPEAENQIGGTIYFDSLNGPPAVPNHGVASPSSSSSGVSTEQHTQESGHPVANAQNQWPLRPFIPYVKAKLSDPRGCYTPDDMCQELHGLVLESMCMWLEITRLSLTNFSPAPATNDGSACPHLGFWNKEFGQPGCDNCHLWKPLFILTCPGCGLKKCLRCKFEDSRH